MQMEATARHSISVLIAAILTLALIPTLEASPAAAAMSDACSVKNTDTGRTYKALQTAVDAATTGARLVVKGTCVGTTRIDKDLSIEGARTAASRKPTLDGVRKGRVMVVDRGPSSHSLASSLRTGAPRSTVAGSSIEAR